MSQQYKVGSHKTTVKKQHGITHVTYHDTIVVAFGKSGVELNSGGWKTSTTKTRMNQTSHEFDLGYKVYQKNFDWFVTFKSKTMPFEDGMTLSL